MLSEHDNWFASLPSAADDGIHPIANKLMEDHFSYIRLVPKLIYLRFQYVILKILNFSFLDQ